MHEVRVERLEREIDRRAGPPRLELDAARHPIAGREIAGRIVALHEALARLVEQPRTLAAQRLREQESRLPGHLQRRRVELHELEIGHRRAGAVRHGHAVAGRHGRIGRVAEDMTGAAGREQHHLRSDDARAPVLVQDLRADAAADLAVNDQADRARVIRRSHVGQRRRAPPQHAADLPAGRIVGVQHAPRAVRALDRQRRIAVGVAVERGAPLHQLADVAWPVADEHFHRLRVAQPVASGHRVGGMQRRRIVRPDRSRDTALGIAGVALARLRLRQDQDRSGARKLHRRPEARYAAADDEEVCVQVHSQSDPAILPSATFARIPGLFCRLTLTCPMRSLSRCEHPPASIRSRLPVAPRHAFRRSSTPSASRGGASSSPTRRCGGCTATPSQA